MLSKNHSAYLGHFRIKATKEKNSIIAVKWYGTVVKSIYWKWRKLKILVFVLLPIVFLMFENIGVCASANSIFNVHNIKK